MPIKCVIDSSTLISLAKIDQLALLEKLGFVFFCPEEVYAETVEMSVLHGYYEGLKIKTLFDENILTRKKIGKVQIKGISNVDAKVIALATSMNATVLANDTALARIAMVKNLQSFGSPDILFLAREKRIISTNEFKRKINELVEKRRLSDKNAKRYVEGD